MRVTIRRRASNVTTPKQARALPIATLATASPSVRSEPIAPTPTLCGAGYAAVVDSPPHEPVTHTKPLAGQLSFAGYLTLETVTRGIRSDKRLLGLLALLVIGLPIVTWALPLPGAASISIAVVAGVGLSWLGYEAIGDVIERTIRE
jgi:hypothetical protein